jgi:hypothetical protein
MHDIRYFGSAWLASMLVFAGMAPMPVSADSTPEVNDAVINTRIFNDCPTSILTTSNLYPFSIEITDEVLDCGGFANLHNWRFSADGGATAAAFNNDSAFKFSATLIISGTSEGEAGLQISPWWSQNVDGRLNVRTTDGEIAAFGGRLPFYSFTGSQGVTYTKGDAIRLTITYLPNSLSMADPATIEYELLYNNTIYTSGELPFDEGNPDEDPPYGLWGILNDARVGGHVQPFLQGGNPDAGLSAEWREIKFLDLKTPISVEESSFGKVKGMYR